ncbi:MAG: hypothetical protein ACRDQY_23475, partial [Pseudonocardiaceae bacterium]
RPSRQRTNRYKIDNSSIRRSSMPRQHTRNPGQDAASSFRALQALVPENVVPNLVRTRESLECFWVLTIDDNTSCALFPQVKAECLVQRLGNEPQTESLG